MTNAMAINNKGLYKDEMLSDEQLDMVYGGSGEWGMEAMKMLIEKGGEEVTALKTLVNSDEYKAMSIGDRNKRLGKELANSLALSGIIGAIATPITLAYTQYKWRTSGTSDDIRKFIEGVL